METTISIPGVAAGLAMLIVPAAHAGDIGEVETIGGFSPLLVGPRASPASPGLSTEDVLLTISPATLEGFRRRTALAAELNTYVCAEGSKSSTLPFSPESINPETPDPTVSRLRVETVLPIDRKSSDHASMLLADYMLGQATTSRLWTRLREREGLAYAVESSVNWSSANGTAVWALEVNLPEKHKDRVAELLVEEINRVRQNGFTEEELNDAKVGLKKYRQLWRARNTWGDANIKAFSLGARLEMATPLQRDVADAKRVDDDLSSASLGQVNSALRRYIDPARFTAGFVRGTKE